MGFRSNRSIPKDCDLRRNITTILKQFWSVCHQILPSGGICLIYRCCGPHWSFLDHLTPATAKSIGSDIRSNEDTIHKLASNLDLIWPGFKNGPDQSGSSLENLN